ncbi:MAG: DUF1579 family protein [Phycisphaerales bacterium]|nr:DUF1579 family protein [Phycisphaerales bacterium]
MTRMTLVSGSLVLLAASFLGAGLARVEQPRDAAPRPSAQPAPSVETGAVESIELPGAAHAELTRLVGDWSWTSVLRMSPDSPGSEPEGGSASVEAILDGRFIAIREIGLMLGESIESLKILGHNNAAGVYEGTWLYTGSTATMRLRGQSEDNNRLIVCQAQYATGPEQQQRFLVTISIRSNDEFSTSLVALLPDGSSGPTIDTTYRRQ